MPTYPNPCCRCGFCCLSETCPEGQRVYRVGKHGPCPGLSFEGDMAVCKLIEHGGGKSAPDGLEVFIFGLGAGCCIKARCIKDGVTYDFATLPPHFKRSIAQTKRALI